MSRDVTAPSPVNPSDTALVLAIRAGEKWAGEALFQRHLRVARHLAQRVSRGQLDADDVLQDALLEAFRNLETLENPQAFSAWLTAIVTRRASKQLRRRQMRLRLGFDAPVRSEAEAAAAGNPTPEVMSELRAVASILSSLAHEERSVLLLRRVEEMELCEIARRLQLSVATIKRRLARAGTQMERDLGLTPRASSRHARARTIPAPAGRHELEARDTGRGGT